MKRAIWNFANVWEAVAERFPEEPAQLVGGRRMTWREFDTRADGIAAWLMRQDMTHQSKVAQYLYNGPEYLESLFGIFKLGLVPVNTNYRYTVSELAYLWNNADVEAVIFHAAFSDRCDELRHKLRGIRAWLCAVPPGGECPSWATPYDEVAHPGFSRFQAPWGRSGDDLMLLYTGGTTGLPKGVMWPQENLFRMLEGVNGRSIDDVPDPRSYVRRLHRPGPRVLPAAPLMHGTGLWFTMPVLNQAGCVVTIEDRSFSAQTLLDTISREKVKGVCIVGDAFARPLVKELETSPGRWNVGSVRVVFSSGVVLSSDTKEALHRHMPNATIIDGLGTSESGPLARSSSVAGDSPKSEFTIGPNTRVIDEAGYDIAPGSGQRGRLAVSGYIPTGYYGDEEKTRETFVSIDGRTHVVTGDWAEVHADGTIHLLGRGSVCINTGGEKVFPEEVEYAVKLVSGVFDAIVVGLPDARFGETVTALVEVEQGQTVTVDRIKDHVAQSLAGYKVPRHILFVASLRRGPNGKADYNQLRQWALERLSASGHKREPSEGTISTE